MRKIQMRNIKLFEEYSSSYYLLGDSVKSLENGLNWFFKNQDITSGFIKAVDNNGEICKDISSCCEKESNGYLVKLSLFNYDGGLIDSDWNLEFIHRFMNKDGLDVNIIQK